MSNSLVPIDPRIVEALEKAELDIAVGDLYLDKDGAILKITEIYVYDKTGSVLIKKSAYEGNDHWHSWGVSSVKDWGYYYSDAIKLNKNVHPDQHIKNSIMLFSSFEEWRPKAEGNPDETTLVASGTKAHVVAMREATQQQMEKVETVRRMIAAKVSGMYSVVRQLQDQIKAISKIIGVFELYLGIHEQIVQIGEGECATMDTPITIHQAVLYMDEEAGIISWRYGQQGIDFQRVEDFDEWLIPNIDRILPEQKGVILLKPSRQRRKYSPNPFQNAMLNANNEMSYVLVRNGQKVYRIWTGTSLGNQFIPGPNELESLFLKAQESNSLNAKSEAQEKEFKYRKHALLLQGLLDRTDIFKPMTHLVSLGKPETYGDLVDWVYDSGPALTDGLHVSYDEWKKELNSHIKRGTRVLVSEQWQRKKSYADRFKVYYSHEDNCPPAPQTGVYVIDHEAIFHRYGSETQAYYIMYNPGDEVAGAWYQEWHKRKRRVSYALFAGDSNVLNYDMIELDDIDFYINCRWERHNYLKMLPVLMKIRDARLEELKWEKDFVALVAGRCDVEKDVVWAAVKWWKNKVIWKRPIMQDDAKALRMIEAKVKRDQNNA